MRKIDWANIYIALIALAMAVGCYLIGWHKAAGLLVALAVVQAVFIFNRHHKGRARRKYKPVKWDK